MLTFDFVEVSGTTTPDTATAGTIGFRGPGAPYTEWEWRIGNDARTFRQQQVSLYFRPSTMSFQALAVRLIARRAPAKNCFPKDDGVDTLTRVLTLMPDPWPRAALMGRWHGANLDAPRDTFTVRIGVEPDRQYPGNPAAPPMVYMANLGKGCNSPRFQLVDVGYYGASFDYGLSDLGCKSEAGTAQVSADRRSIRIEYSQMITSPNRTSRVFVGQRVP